MPPRAAAVVTPPRRSFIARGGLVLLGAMLSPWVAAQTAESAAAPQKVLRYAMRVAETGFDPAQVTDLYSNTLIANIFDAPYALEFLARPVRIRPNTAASMPEIADDFTTFTVRIKPGIFFTDDPAFKGKKRELVAEDYVYTIKRHFDPRWKNGKLSEIGRAHV